HDKLVEALEDFIGNAIMAIMFSRDIKIVGEIINQLYISLERVEFLIGTSYLEKLHKYSFSTGPVIPAQLVLDILGIEDNLEGTTIFSQPISRWTKDHNLLIDALPSCDPKVSIWYEEFVDIRRKRYKSLSEVESFILGYARRLDIDSGTGDRNQTRTKQWIENLKEAARKRGVKSIDYLTGRRGPHIRRNHSDSPLIWAAKGHFFESQHQKRMGKLFANFNLSNIKLIDLPIWPVDQEGNILTNLVEWMSYQGRAPPRAYYLARKVSLKELLPEDKLPQPKLNQSSLFDDQDLSASGNKGLSRSKVNKIIAKALEKEPNHLILDGLSEEVNFIRMFFGIGQASLDSIRNLRYERIANALENIGIEIHVLRGIPHRGYWRFRKQNRILQIFVQSSENIKQTAVHEIAAAVTAKFKFFDHYLGKEVLRPTSHETNLEIEEDFKFWLEFLGYNVSGVEEVQTQHQFSQRALDEILGIEKGNIDLTGNKEGQDYKEEVTSSVAGGVSSPALLFILMFGSISLGLPVFVSVVLGIFFFATLFGSILKTTSQAYPLADAVKALSQNCFDQDLRSRNREKEALDLREKAVRAPDALRQKFYDSIEGEIILPAPAYRASFIHFQLDRRHIGNSYLKLVYTFNSGTKVYHSTPDGDIALSEVDDDNSWIGAELPSVSKFVFKKQTNLEEIIVYLTSLRIFLGASSGREAAKTEAIKALSQLIKRIKLLLDGRDLFERKLSKEEPCLGCVNKGGCPLVAALLKGKDTSKVKEDDDCQKRERCKISKEDATVAVDLATKIKELLEQEEASDLNLRKIDRLLVEVAKKEGGSIGVLRNNSKQPYMTELEVASAAGLDAILREKCKKSLISWLNYKGKRQAEHKPAIRRYIQYLKYDDQENLSGIYFVFSEDGQEIEAIADLGDLYPSFIEIAPWNRNGLGNTRKYKGIGSQLRSFMIRKLLSIFGDHLYAPQLIGNAIALGNKDPDLADQFSPDVTRRDIEEFLIRQDKISQANQVKDAVAANSSQTLRCSALGAFIPTLVIATQSAIPVGIIVAGVAFVIVVLGGITAVALLKGKKNNGDKDTDTRKILVKAFFAKFRERDLKAVKENFLQKGSNREALVEALIIQFRITNPYRKDHQNLAETCVDLIKSGELKIDLKRDNSQIDYSTEDSFERKERDMLLEALKTDGAAYAVLELHGSKGKASLFKDGESFPDLLDQKSRKELLTSFYQAREWLYTQVNILIPSQLIVILNLPQELERLDGEIHQLVVTDTGLLSVDGNETRATRKGGVTIISAPLAKDIVSLLTCIAHESQISHDAQREHLNRYQQHARGLDREETVINKLKENRQISRERVRQEKLRLIDEIALSEANLGLFESEFIDPPEGNDYSASKVKDERRSVNLKVTNLRRLAHDYPLFVADKTLTHEGIHWEANGAFNMAAFTLDGDKRTIYGIYRAEGEDKISRLGLAIIKLNQNDQVEGVTRFPHPIISPEKNGFDHRGCEDPRTEVIEVEENSKKVKKIAVSYSAVKSFSIWQFIREFDFHFRENSWLAYMGKIIKGSIKLIIELWDYFIKQTNNKLFAHPAVALMDVDQFKQCLATWIPGQNDHIWQWQKYVVRDAIFDNEYNKDVVIFQDAQSRLWALDRPNGLDQGKPKHKIRYRRILNLKSRKWDKLKQFITPRGKTSYREDWIGAGTNVIKLDSSLLMFYHSAIEDAEETGIENHRSYFGHLILLDKNDPTQILWRSKEPVISPKIWWEKGGLGGKLDHVFPEGLVLLENRYKDGREYAKLLMFYGARDEFVGAALVEVEINNKEKTNDPHRAKPGMHPTDAQTQSDLTKAKLITNRDYLDSALNEAISLSKDKDPKIAHALEEIKNAIEIRAGPFSHIYGSYQGNILYLDETILSNTNQYRELIITLIHEARVIAYPNSLDQDNEKFAVKVINDFLDSLEEFSYQDLEKEGYRVSLEPEIDSVLGIERVKVRIFKNGQELSGVNVSFLVFDQFKTIEIENFYPNFPHQRRGRGRALLRFLINQPKYAGYQIISLATQSFQKSFQKAEEFNPAVDVDSDELELIKERFLRSLEEPEQVNSWLQNPTSMEHLKKAWESTTLFGIVPPVDFLSSFSSYSSPNASYGEGILDRHHQVDSIIDFFPKEVIKKGKYYYLRQNEKIKKNGGDNNTEENIDSELKGKIDKALELVGEKYPERVVNFRRDTSIVLVGVPTFFLLYGKDNQGKIFFQLTHIGRERRTIYIAKKFLEEIEDITVLATLLNHDQQEVERYGRILNKGKEVTLRLEELIHKRAMQDDPFDMYGGLDLFLEKLVAEKPSEEIFTKVAVLEKISAKKAEIKQKRSQIRRIKKSGKRSELRFRYSELAYLYRGKGLLYESIAKRKDALRCYKLSLYNFESAEKADPGGLFPIQLQVQILFVLAAEGMVEDLLREIDQLISLTFKDKISATDKKHTYRYFLASNFPRLKKTLIHTLEHYCVNEADKRKKVKIRQAVREIQEKNYVSEDKKRAEQKRDPAKTNIDTAALESLVDKHHLIDVSGPISRNDALRCISKTASEETGIDANIIFAKFIERENESSTVIGKGVAIPHIILADYLQYEVFLFRCKEGIKYPGEEKLVKVMFALMGPRNTKEQNQLHMKTISEIAQLVSEPDFMERVNAVMGKVNEKDPHRAKSSLNPTDAQTQSDLVKAKLLADRECLDSAIDQAIQLAKGKDFRVAHALEEIKNRVEIRAGPFSYIYGAYREDTLYLDKSLLKNSKNYKELVLTLIHEAAVFAYPENSDFENESIAQKIACLERAKVSEVSAIQLAKSLNVDNREQLQAIVETPLVRACQLLFDRGIKTIATSANARDVLAGYAYIKIDRSSLTIFNQEIANRVCEGIHRDEIRIKLEKESTVESVSKQAEKLVANFEPQINQSINFPQSNQGVNKELSGCFEIDFSTDLKQAISAVAEIKKLLNLLSQEALIFQCYSVSILASLFFDNSRVVENAEGSHCWLEVGNQKTGWLIDASLDTAPLEIRKSLISVSRYFDNLDLEKGIAVLPIREARKIYGPGKRVDLETNFSWSQIKEVFSDKSWVEPNGEGRWQESKQVVHERIKSIELKFDLHRAKPGENPNRKQLEEDLSKANKIREKGLIEQSVRDCFPFVYSADPNIAKALGKFLTEVEIRAGPFTYIYGAYRENTLYLDQALLQYPENYKQLLITLIHEAAVLVYPESSDQENEKFAQNCYFWIKLTKQVTVGILLIPTVIIISFFALIIKSTSTGSAFFKQKRVGFRGKIFTVYKLRTMSASGKVTRLGKFLRVTAIDELPQLLNWFKQELSLFGPRPLIRDEVNNDYIDKVLMRQRPGFLNFFSALTGPAKGKQPVELHLRCAEYDRKNSSIFWRIKLVIATFWAILFRSQMGKRMQFLGIDSKESEDLERYPVITSLLVKNCLIKSIALNLGKRIDEIIDVFTKLGLSRKELLKQDLPLKKLLEIVVSDQFNEFFDILDVNFFADDDFEIVFSYGWPNAVRIKKVAEGRWHAETVSASQCWFPMGVNSLKQALDRDKFSEIDQIAGLGGKDSKVVALEKAKEIFSFCNSGVEGFDSELTRVINKLKTLGFLKDGESVGHIRTELKKYFSESDNIEIYPPGIALDREGMGPTLEELSRERVGLIYILVNRYGDISYDYSSDIWLECGDKDYAVIFLADRNSGAITLHYYGDRANLEQARIKAQMFLDNLADKSKGLEKEVKIIYLNKKGIYFSDPHRVKPGENPTENEAFAMNCLKIDYVSYSFLRGLGIDLSINLEAKKIGSLNLRKLTTRNSNYNLLFQAFGFPVCDDVNFYLLFDENKPVALILDPTELDSFNFPPDMPAGCIIIVDVLDVDYLNELKDRIKEEVIFLGRKIHFVGIDKEKDTAEYIYKLTGHKGPPLLGFPGVFTTDMTSEMIAKNSFQLIPKNSKVLVVGCGRGLDVICAGLSNAVTVDAIDLSSYEIENTRMNLKLWGLETVNVFKNKGLDGLGQYDLIIFNAPLVEMDQREPENKRHHLSAKDYKGKINQDFLRRLKQHLTPSGFAIYSNEYSGETKDCLDSWFIDFGIDFEILASKEVRKTIYYRRDPIEINTRHVVFKVSEKPTRLEEIDMEFVRNVESILRGDDQEAKNRLREKIMSQSFISRENLQGSFFEPVAEELFVSSDKTIFHPLHDSDTSKAVAEEVAVRDIEDAIVLDLGCGMGIQAFFALSRGAKKVVCVDNKPFALLLTLLNADLLGCLDRIFIDLASINPKWGWGKPNSFDLIISNAPPPQDIYGMEPEDMDYFMKHYYNDNYHDPNYQFLYGLLKRGQVLLKKDGVIIFGSFDEINDDIERYKYDIQRKRYKKEDHVVFTLSKLKFESDSRRSFFNSYAMFTDWRLLHKIFKFFGLEKFFLIKIVAPVEEAIFAEKLPSEFAQAHRQVYGTSESGKEKKWQQPNQQELESLRTLGFKTNQAFRDAYNHNSHLRGGKWLRWLSGWWAATKVHAEYNRQAFQKEQVLAMVERKSTDVSKWDLLDLFREKLNKIDDQVALRLKQTNDLGQRREILLEAGISVTSEIDGKFLTQEVDKLIELRSPKKEPVKAKRNILRYGGQGRHLIAYLSDFFDYIIKTYHDQKTKDQSTKDYALNAWLKHGYKIARQRLAG
ncbi:MAG: sugar transferase, partial [Candidatus Omnitrophica bacterium]|nr:sugar transferase [Candidatus Omnitrophota bacterium]